MLVTGTGRSGTSTMAGMLHHLGLDVPGPHLAANDSNPRGFFESRWSVRFHSQILARAEVHLTDSRPWAAGLVRDAVTDEDRSALADFFERHQGADQLVVKDPRTIWTQDLWASSAAAAGRETRFVTMLRHPAEVVGSRASWYGDPDATEAERRSLAVTNLTRWVNNSLVSERGTRDGRRMLVRFTDLLADWRPTARRLRDELGLDLAGDLADGSAAHPVDDFVDPALRRSTPTWADLAMPSDLEAVAEAAWHAQSALADPGAVTDEGVFDDLTERYAAMYADAGSVRIEATNEFARAHTRQAMSEAPARGPDTIAGRDLARELARRVSARLPRSRRRP